MVRSRLIGENKMKNPREITVIIPSFHSMELTMICIKSFQKFSNDNVLLKYVVVENSIDMSYKEKILELARDIKWINNDTLAVGSEANAEAIEIALKMVDTELVFITHCDTCVVSNNFFGYIIDKYDNGNKVVGTQVDTHPNRIKALHVLGLLSNTDIAKCVKYMPHYEQGQQIMDVGDELTKYCRDNDIEHYCFRNTFNDPTIVCNSIYENFRVDRCVDENNNVIFMHLGRGIPKTQGQCWKKKWVSLAQWIEFCNRVLGEN